MPEGHVIHRLARDHARDFVGQTLRVASPQGRFAAGAKLLDGSTLEEVEAYGKHLCYRWEAGHRLHIHLGLYGKFRSGRVPLPPPRGLVRLRVWGDAKGFDLNGPNACELLSDAQWYAKRSRLGPDPLRPDADPEAAWKKIARSRAPLGALLLNQAVIAGVGNVYRSEALHLLGIAPGKAGKELSRDQFDQLWQTLGDLLKVGVRYNRIIVADPAEIGVPRSRMNRSERLLIYKRHECGRCGSAVETEIIGGRKSFACPQCQR